MYKFYNANARGNFVNDCVIRSISLAEGKTWDETYEELSDIAQYEGILLDDVDFVEGYLDKRYKRVPHCSRTVGELIEECPHGTYLVTMEGHITVIVNGVLYDTFDCRDRRIWCIWQVPKK
jgi:hypothetical protein